MVINTKEDIPTFIFEKPVNKSRTDTLSITLDNSEQWFMMGYFMGDGWIEDTKKSDGRCSDRCLHPGAFPWQFQGGIIGCVSNSSGYAFCNYPDEYL